MGKSKNVNRKPGMVNQEFANSPKCPLPFHVEKPVVFEPSDMPCIGAVIWLHGFGDRPDGWASILARARNTNPQWKWIHPCAPPLPQPCYGGGRCLGWGDLTEESIIKIGSADHESNDSSGYYAATVAMVHQHILSLELEDKVPPEKVVVAGFSQGAAAASQATMQFSRRLAGCIMVSGWLLPAAREAIACRQNHHTNVLVCHGTDDDQVALECAEFAANTLRDSGAALELAVFSGLAHEPCADEVEIIETFLQYTLAGRGLLHLENRILSSWQYL